MSLNFKKYVWPKKLISLRELAGWDNVCFGIVPGFKPTGSEFNLNDYADIVRPVTKAGLGYWVINAVDKDGTAENVVFVAAEAKKEQYRKSTYKKIQSCIISVAKDL